MISVHSDLVQFKGSHYEFGYHQGELLRNSAIMEHRKKLWGPKKERHFLIDQATYESIIKTFMPKMWDELNGLADALKMTLKESIIEFGGYYLEYGRSGCSIFTTNEYMVRNYDNHPNTYEGRYAIYEPTDGGYATIGPTMQITGRTDGMNEKGLAMGYNFINRRGSNDGFVCNMIGRIILETCANAQEAIELLKEIPHRHSFSFVLLDPKGETYIVEATPRDVAVHQGFYCTNHFKQLTDENRYRMEDSETREKAIVQGASMSQDMIGAYELLNDPKNGVYSSKYGAFAGTLHTALYAPREMKVGIALGSQKYPLMLDVNHLLTFPKLRIKQIKGTIKYDRPFINIRY